MNGDCFDTLAAELHTLRNRFGETERAARRRLLAQAAERDWPLDERLVAWHDTLLFIAAHPADAAEHRAVEATLRRLTTLLKAAPADTREALAGSGLPYTPIQTRFTHDALRWMRGQRAFRTRFDGFWQGSLDLNAFLALTLPALERGPTTAGLAAEDLLAALQVPKSQWLDFLIAQAASLDDRPLLKDHLFDALGVYVRLDATGSAFSRAWNRLPVPRVFHHDAMPAPYDTRELLDRPLPAPVRLTAATREQVVEVVRRTMALSSRETDPATYMDPATLRLWPLERGLAVALFGMRPERQLPAESYVGFTAFKNGLPAAYGGAWVFGRHMKFGINIFEPYRGGESGLLMVQILRAYRQAFGTELLGVEPYQYGRDNPDGIASGAFWFYYKHGFRPADAELAALAQREKQRMAARPGHRSSRRTLLRFTDSELQLRLAGTPPDPTVAEVTERATALIRRRFGGDRTAAEHSLAESLRRRAGLAAELGPAREAVLRETALMAAACALDTPARLPLLAALVDAKPTDPYRYQRLLLDLFAPATDATR